MKKLCCLHFEIILSLRNQRCDANAMAAEPDNPLGTTARFAQLVDDEVEVLRQALLIASEICERFVLLSIPGLV